MPEEKQRPDLQNPEAGAEGNGTQQQEQQNTQQTEENPKSIISPEELGKLMEALEKGNFNEFFSALGEDAQKRFQSFLDQERARAMKTREENMRKQQEREMLQKKGEFEKLMKLDRKAALESFKEAYLKANGLPDNLSDLVGVSEDLLDLSFEEAKEALKRKIENVATTFNSTIEKLVQAKLEQLERGTHIPSTGARRLTKEEIKKMSPEEINKNWDEIQKMLEQGG